MRRFARITVLVVTCFAALSLLAPSVAFALDDYERIGLVPPFDWDNYPEHATPYAASQIHTFETLDAPFLAHDEDWVAFTATADSAYYLQAYPMAGSVANPVIMLYSTNGWQLIGISDDAVLGSNNARYAWTCPASGTYYLRVIDWYGLGTPDNYRIDVVLRGGVPAVDVTRPNAPDRYVLAANLGLAGWPGWTGVTDVIVACGADRAAADPLAASGLAGVYEAPILLVQTDPTRVVVPAATSSALAAIRAATGSKPQIHVVGGPASVTAGQVAVLKGYDKDGVIDRIGGANRYEVAAGIAARMRSKLGAGYPKTAIFCNGHDAAYFWNALAAGPIAYRMKYPILLTTMAGVPAATNAQKGFYTTRYVVGTPTDTYAVVLSSLGANRIGWSGSDRPGYHREVVARRVVERGGDVHWIGNGDAYSFSHIAYANRLADSLVGGTFAGRMNGGLLFTYSASYIDEPRQHAIYGDHPTDPNREFLVGRRDILGDAWILGGTASVNESVRTEMRRLLGQTGL